MNTTTAYLDELLRNLATKKATMPWVTANDATIDSGEIGTISEDEQKALDAFYKKYTLISFAVADDAADSSAIAADDAADDTAIVTATAIVADDTAIVADDAAIVTDTAIVADDAAIVTDAAIVVDAAIVTDAAIVKVPRKKKILGIIS